MDNKNADHEQVNLLQTLLDHEYAQREFLAKSLHGEKGNLSLVVSLMHRLEKSISEGKPNLTVIADQKEILNSFLEAARSISYGIYPPMIHYLGVPSRIKLFIEKCALKHQIPIDFNEHSDNSIKLIREKEIGIYINCTEIIEYMCLLKAKHLSVNINIIKGYFNFELEDVKPKISKTGNSELEFKLNLIKARLLWQNGEVMKPTNWKDKISIRFYIQDSLVKA